MIRTAIVVAILLYALPRLAGAVHDVERCSATVFVPSAQACRTESPVTIGDVVQSVIRIGIATLIPHGGN